MLYSLKFNPLSFYYYWFGITFIELFKSLIAGLLASDVKNYFNDVTFYDKCFGVWIPCGA